MKNRLGKNIAELRRKKGWSQKETAAKLGISQALLSHYEKGIRECGLDFLCKASKVFSVSADYLLGLEDKNSSLPPDSDNIHADLKQFPKLEKSLNDTLNTLSLLYSITARVGNPEICKDFNKIIFSDIYMLTRLFEQRYFANENFEKNIASDIADANQINACAAASIIKRMTNENINVNLSKERIANEYPTCSKSFNNIISTIEK